MKKARECSSLQSEIDELKNKLDEKSKEVNKLKRELGVKLNEATALESRMAKLSEEMKKMNRDHLDKLNQSKFELQQLRSEMKCKYFHDLSVFIYFFHSSPHFISFRTHTFESKPRIYVDQGQMIELRMEHFVFQDK